MGFKGDKSIVYTKNKFEAYLNTEESKSFWESIDMNIKFKDDKNKGSVLRRKDKTEFDRQYLIWLNTK